MERAVILENTTTVEREIDIGSGFGLIDV